ncbi:MAG: N-acetylmuramic acid 6-phosphate etherase [bacterium]|nr:N-acetylmuramic acid 6-phosphate etherase [bacterium]
MVKLDQLTTEARNPNTSRLDTMTPLEIVTIMNREDENVIQGVKEVLAQVASAIEWVKEAFEAGGRLIYMGAGTSGRLGVLDSVECPPTFGVSPDMVVGLIAGGDRAFVKAVEGAEDSETLAQEELEAQGLSSKDIVIGIAASGRTPYVISGLQYAHAVGCRTVAIACNKNSAVGAAADLAIEPEVGPEVLTGSTRLKAGTAQKMILNMISTGAMVGIGKVYQNLMVDVMQTNEKLCVRAHNIVREATGCSSERAAALLEEAGGSVKAAIVMELTGCTADEAVQKLEKARGHIRNCI